MGRLGRAGTELGWGRGVGTRGVCGVGRGVRLRDGRERGAFPRHADLLPEG